MGRRRSIENLRLPAIHPIRGTERLQALSSRSEAAGRLSGVSGVVAAIGVLADTVQPGGCPDSDAPTMASQKQGESARGRSRLALIQALSTSRSGKLGAGCHRRRCAS